MIQIRNPILCLSLLTALSVACNDPDSKTQASWHFDSLSLEAGPTARYDATLTSDSATDTLYLYGGRGGEGLLADFWALDLKAKKPRWLCLSEQAAPGPRSGAVLVALGAGRLLLHGGYRANEFGAIDFLQDLWFYSPADGWQREFISGGPSARAWHAARLMASDSHKPRNLILFGGYAGAPDYHLQDLWRLDIEKLTWKRLATDGGPLGTGRPLLWLDPKGKSLRVLNRQGIPKATKTMTWTLKLEANQWLAEAGTTHLPLSYQVAASAQEGNSWLLLKGPGPDSQESNWLIWLCDPSQKCNWSTAWTDSGPLEATGMACTSDPIEAKAWLCFGGAQRASISHDLWRLSPNLADKRTGS
ncbi:MAG: hypothetical protein JRF33_03350 [Deltaproteobacteria bacterium]|nr:hypothetical protein [Deltaproteobacteria bacterium]